MEFEVVLLEFYVRSNLLTIKGGRLTLKCELFRVDRDERATATHSCSPPDRSRPPSDQAVESPEKKGRETLDLKRDLTRDMRKKKKGSEEDIPSNEGASSRLLCSDTCHSKVHPRQFSCLRRAALSSDVCCRCSDVRRDPLRRLRSLYVG